MDALQDRIGYRFRNPDVLTLAFTHPSMAAAKNNQRLEFLGDAILGAIVAKLLYDLYPGEKEGELARRHASLVRGETLTACARELELGKALHIGASETQSQGRNNASNLEDAMEALIGALYLDGGMQAAENFIIPRWTKIAQRSETPPKDAKTALQEWAQARSLPIPSYRMQDSTGPAHAPQFTIEVTLPGYPPAQATAHSKRVAEQAAAGALLERVSHD